MYSLYKAEQKDQLRFVWDVIELYVLISNGPLAVYTFNKISVVVNKLYSMNGWMIETFSQNKHLEPDKVH